MKGKTKCHPWHKQREDSSFCHHEKSSSQEGSTVHKSTTGTQDLLISHWQFRTPLVYPLSISLIFCSRTWPRSAVRRSAVQQPLQLRRDWRKLKNQWQICRRTWTPWTISKTQFSEANLTPFFPLASFRNALIWCREICKSNAVILVAWWDLWDIQYSDSITVFVCFAWSKPGKKKSTQSLRRLSAEPCTYVGNSLVKLLHHQVLEKFSRNNQ